jgi:hypothetical protein
VISERAAPAIAVLDLLVVKRGISVLGPAGIGALALGSGALVLYATPFGIGTGWDQSMYIGAARGLIAGHGLSIPWGIDAGQPLTHFPPLFPLLLAGFGLAGIDPFDGARYLNAVLRGANLVFLALLVARVEPRSVVAPLVGACLFFTSVHMASIHGRAWSEPLFMPLCFAALFALAAYMRQPAWSWLVVSAALAGGALLTRYVGLAIVLTALFLIAVGTGRPVASRLRHMLVFGLLACTPLVVWSIRNLIVGQPALGYRDLAWHPAALQQLGLVALVVFDWFVPNQVASRLVSAGGSIIPFGAVVLALAALAVVVSVARLRNVALHPLVGRVLPVFVVAYLASVLVASTFFDHRIQIDSRTLAPVYVALVVAIGVATARFPNRAIAVGLVGLLCVGNAGRLVGTTQREHAEGISFSSTKYLASGVMARARELPDSAIVYSNAPDAIYLVTNRQAFEISDAAMPGYVAYFSDPDIAYRQQTPSMLEGRFGLTLVERDASGELLLMTESAGEP